METSEEEMTATLQAALSGTGPAAEASPTSEPQSPADSSSATPAATSTTAPAANVSSQDTGNGGEEEEEEVEQADWQSPATYHTISSIIFVGLLAMLVAIHSSIHGLSNLFNMTQNWSKGLVWSLVLYIAASFRVVKEDEVATLVIFGITVADVQGPVLAPLGIAKLVVFDRGVIQMEIPAEPEDIWRGDEHSVAPEGKKPPIRIPFGQKTETEEQKSDPLYRRVTEEVTPVIRFKILSPSVFVKVIGSLEAARAQLEDVVVGFLTQHLPKIPLAELLAHKETYDGLLYKQVVRATRDWGIEIESAKIKMVNMSRALNTKIQLAAEAVPEKVARIIKAEGEGRAFELEGIGRGRGDAAQIRERSLAMHSAAIALDTSGENVLAAETARHSSSGANKTLLFGATAPVKEFAGLIDLLPEGKPPAPVAQNPTPGTETEKSAAPTPSGTRST